MEVKIVKVDWSSYCQSVERTMLELEHELGLALEIVDGDVDKARVNSWGVKSYPTTLICDHAGKVRKTLVGVKTKQELKEFIEE